MKYKVAILLLALQELSYTKSQHALCTVPVADLVSMPFAYAQLEGLSHTHYEQQPFSAKSSSHGCLRLSQLLLHEPVTIIEERGNECKVRIIHWYHDTPTDRYNSIYWIKKSALTPFDEIDDDDLAKKLPLPISFKKRNIPVEGIVALVTAWQDPKTGLVYSAGTRFKKAAEHPDQQEQWKVYCFDQSLGRFNSIKIPRSYCIEPDRIGPNERRTAFLSIIRRWAHENGFIPYVLGGASVGLPLKENVSFVKKIPTAKQTFLVHERNLPTKEPAKYGLDCAHTIARAAQLVGIPYFIKNTTAIRNTLEPLKAGEHPQDGDIIVWQGHTAVISDVQKGLIIEARSYDHGYGIVQEIPIREQFKDVNSIEELFQLSLAHKPIKRLNKAGKVVQTIGDLLIVKLPV